MIELVRMKLSRLGKIFQPMLLILDYHLQLIQSILWTGELILQRIDGVVQLQIFLA